jgi:hypothetical protein
VQVTLSFQSVVLLAGQNGHMMSWLADKELFGRDGLLPWFPNAAKREDPEMICDAEKLIEPSLSHRRRQGPV